MRNLRINDREIYEVWKKYKHKILETDSYDVKIEYVRFFDNNYLTEYFLKLGYLDNFTGCVVIENKVHIYFKNGVLDKDALYIIKELDDNEEFFSLI